MHKDMLLKKLNDKTAVIGIVGLGYVGLPLSLRYSEVGYKVVGFDIDQSKVDVLKRGQTYIEHIGSEGIAKAIEQWLRADLGSVPGARSGCADPLRSDAAEQVPRAGSQLRAEHGRCPRAALARRPDRVAGEHDLSRHDRGGAASAHREGWLHGRRGRVPRVLAGARGSGQREVQHPHDSRRSAAASRRPASRSASRSTAR